MSFIMKYTILSFKFNPYTNTNHRTAIAQIWAERFEEVY